MKKWLPALFIIILLSTGCKKKAVEYASTGVLNGPDLALCACCGGIVLQSSDDKNYRIESLPGLTQQELMNLTYPRKIKYNAGVNRNCGGIVYLNITAYEFY
jgi:hypothetical protein